MGESPSNSRDSTAYNGCAGRRGSAKNIAPGAARNLRKQSPIKDSVVDRPSRGGDKLAPFAGTTVKTGKV